jgi:hypothetical protein
MRRYIGYCAILFFLACGLYKTTSVQKPSKTDADASPKWKNNAVNPEVTIKLGMSGQDLSIALGRQRVRTSKQPMGVNFYEIHWPTKFPARVNFIHGVNGFFLDAALSVMGTEDLEILGGVQNLDVNFGVTAADLIPHDEARLEVMALLKRLQDAGWRQNYYFSEARIKGRSTLTDPSSLDVRYTPTFNEWMAVGIRTASWKLQANGVFMDISMHRDGDRMDPSWPGAYIMSMTLETEEQYMRSHFSEQDRDNWKALWPEFSKVLKKARAQKETELRAQGLEIDTDYQDPPILALQAPVVSLRVDQPCSRSGWWQATLPPSHPAAHLLAKAPQRWRQVRAGEPMPRMYSRLMFDSADADNAAITWVWVREA